jgi:hypothetical protein
VFEFQDHKKLCSKLVSSLNVSPICLWRVFLLNAACDMAMLHLISYVHLVSFVIMLPKQLKHSTVSSLYLYNSSSPLVITIIQKNTERFSYNRHFVTLHLTELSPLWKFHTILEAFAATEFNKTFSGKQRRPCVKFGQRLRDGLLPHLQGVAMAWYNQNGDTQHTVRHLVITFGVIKPFATPWRLEMS